MRLQLLLLRHAKSSWNDAETADIDRPLSPRGLRAALTMGKAIAREDFMPDLVLYSPARRAAQTWNAVCMELPRTPPSRTIDTLYDFGDGSALLEAIRQHNGGARMLMLVGHNPSMEELAKRLIGSGPPRFRQQLERKFPTGALAVIGFSADQWDQVTDNSGTLTHFMRPADVEDEV